MKTRIAKQLLSTMLFPLSYLFAELPYEDVSGFLAQKGINLVERDVFYSKEDIIAVLDSFGISTNSMSFREPFAENGCASCKRVLTTGDRRINMEILHAGTATYAQKTMIKKLLVTSMPMDLVLKRYVQSEEFGDVLLYSAYDDVKIKSALADGAVVAFSRGNVAFILSARGRGVAVLDVARNLDAKLVASDATSHFRCAVSRKRKMFIENFVEMPEPLKASIAPKFTNETLCEKLKAYSDGEIQFTDVSLYGESVLAMVRTAKNEEFLLQIRDSSFWDSTIESIGNSVLAMGFTEEEARRRIVTKGTACFHQIYLDREMPRMWAFYNAVEFVAVLQPSSNSCNGEQDFYGSMDRICEILGIFIEKARCRSQS